MRDLIRSIPLRIALAALAIAGGASVIFFARRPVVVVGDVYFDSVYGVSRVEAARAAASFRLFRPVVRADVAPSAAPTSAADVVEAVAPDAYCAVFPARYRLGAEAYAERFPDSRSVVVGTERADSPSASASGTSGPVFLFIDKETDLYRAGLTAGLLASGGRIALSYRREANGVPPAAFTAGLAFSGADPASVLDPAGGAAADAVVACVVSVDSERPPKAPGWSGVPEIVFSWIDPFLLPPEVAVVFDDAPWAVLDAAVRAAASGVSVSVPSGVVVRPKSPGAEWSRSALIAAARAIPR